MDWKNVGVKLAIVIVAIGAMVAANYVDPSVKDTLKTVAMFLFGWVVPAPKFGSAASRPPSVPPSGAAVLLALFCGFATASCAASLEEAKIAGSAYRPLVVKAGGQTPIGVNCVSIDRSRVVWDATAKAAGAIAGAQGIVLIPLPDNDNAAKVGLAAGIVGATVIAVFSEVVSQGFAAEWARYCADQGGGQ